jgi:flagellar M-ring protein FliF
MSRVLLALQQLKDRFLSLSRPHKLLYGSLVVLVALSLAYLFFVANRVEYVPLYSRLSEGEMSAVVEGLKKKKIPYQFSDGGSISVPREQLYDARLSLAAEGIPKGPGAGFEIFDQQKLGSTEFVQKINYQRALQGELARTINQLPEVAESRVHLSIPEESLFLEDKKTPSAAVVLTLKPGAQLNQRQIQGLVHLVCSTVKGLEEDKVTILSTNGQLLFKKAASSNPLQMTNSHLEYKNQVEDSLRQKVQSMLEQVVGSSHVISRVTAELDFNQTQIEQDSFDPDSTVMRSQQRQIESHEGHDPGAKGNPDTPVNMENRLMEGDGKDQAKAKKSNKHRETVNYEMNRVSRKTVQAPGTIKKLSVAVLVDGPYETKADANGQPRLAFVGRSPEQLKALEDIVKKAVGYDEARGDQITVSNTPFANDLATAGDGATMGMRWLEVLQNYQRTLVNVLLMVLVFFFVLRPLLKKVQQIKFEPSPPQLPHRPAGALSATAGVAGEQFLEAPELALDSSTGMRERTLKLVEHDPEKAKDILKTWLRESS